MQVACLQGGKFSLKMGITYVNTENFTEVLIYSFQAYQANRLQR